LQLVVDRVRAAGQGRRLALLMELQQKLASEGLFAAERKRPLPGEPRVVGVVTSAHGAAFQDICTVAHRRGGVRIVLSAATVQGEGAPESLVEAIARVQRYPGLDVLIIGRGGGSGEDLMAFNDERVVRALAAVPVPCVSAVGHEIDYTLCDLVADVRAATPSQAAELVVPDSRARRASLASAKMALHGAMRARLADDRSTLQRLRGSLADPRFLLVERQMLLDEQRQSLERSARSVLHLEHRRLAQLEARLRATDPKVVLVRQRLRLQALEPRLGAAFRAALHRGRSAVADSAARLDALSPLGVLGRGYAIVRRPDGTVLRDAAAVVVGERLGVRLARGALDVEVKRILASTDSPEPPSPAAGEGPRAASVGPIDG